MFFEKWDDPLICGTGWVSKLMENAGGIEIFDDRRIQGPAKDRGVTFDEVLARNRI